MARSRKLTEAQQAMIAAKSDKLNAFDVVQEMGGHDIK